MYWQQKSNMKIFFATDHAGFEMKEEILAFVHNELRYEVEDCGAYEFNAEDDYPEFMHCAAKAVSEDPKNNRAIIFGGSGQGEAMVANRYNGVRATVYCAHNLDIITLSRLHNNANVLSIGARFITIEQAKEAVRLCFGLVQILYLWIGTSEEYKRLIYYRYIIMNFRKNIMQNQSSITKLIIKLGLAKSERQVPVVLMAIIALAVVIMFIAWPSAGNNDGGLPSPSEIEASLNNK